MFGLPTWAWRAIGYALIVLTVLATGAKLMSIWDAGKIAKLQAYQTQVQAAGKQTQAVQRQLTVANSKAEDVTQATLAAQARVVTKEIPVYVTSDPLPPVGCVTWGMLRLHDAAVAGVDASSLEPPAGQPDGACSTVAPSVFMGVVTGNYAAARANGQQLNDLEDDVAARGQAISNPDAPPGVSVPSPLVAPASKE